MNHQSSLHSFHVSQNQSSDGSWHTDISMTPSPDGAKQGVQAGKIVGAAVGSMLGGPAGILPGAIIGSLLGGTIGFMLGK